MSLEEHFDQIKARFVDEKIIIQSVDDGDDLHQKLIKLRTALIEENLFEMMPHYRGEQRSDWPLLSGVFRPPFKITDQILGKQLERKAVAEFEKTILEKIGDSAFRKIFINEKYGKEWDLLFQAQHAGIRTTLTDWTPEITSALYFASETNAQGDNEKADARIWILLVPTENILGHNTNPVRRTYYDLDPYNMKSSLLINVPTYLDNLASRLFENRIYKQKGRFIMPSNQTCNLPINEQPNLKQILVQAIIPADKKAQIRKDLEARGVNRAFIYVENNAEYDALIRQINQSVYGNVGK